MRDPYHHPYYDRAGTPINAERWVELRGADETYLRVALDEIGFYVVSTVWLGIDHAFTGPPLIFETMVFLSGTVVDTYCHRYTTEEQARAGHEAVCAEIRVGEVESVDERADDA